MNSKIIPLPLFNISSDSIGKWIVTDNPGHMELKSNLSLLASKWVLIEGRLVRRGEDFTAHLIIDTIIDTKTRQASVHRIPLPTTRKGVFSEVIYLPKDVKKLILEPMQCKGEIELLDVSLKTIGKWEKNIRMLCRIMVFCEKYSFKFCYKAGLRPHTPIFNLPKAYDIVSRFKYFSSAPDYKNWLKKFDELSVKEYRSIRKHIHSWTSQPHFKVLIYFNEYTEDLLQQTFNSLKKQIFCNFSVILVVPDNHQIESNYSNIPKWIDILEQNSLSLKLKNSEELYWVMIVEPGVIFEAHAIYWFASIIHKERDSRLIYSDHDYINQNNIRINPVFKPDWSPELLRSTNYIGPSITAIRADALLKVIDISELSRQTLNFHELFLKVSEQVKHNAIKHAPAILGHLPLLSMDQKGQFINNSVNPVIDHLKRLGISAVVESKGYNQNRVTYSLPKNRPLISLIIPTRNTLSLLEPCVESILELSSYQNFELIIVDNQSDDPATLNYLDDLKRNQKVRILLYDKPFNYSAINNFAIKESLGEVICLVNNDTEVISSGWLEEMLGHLIQKDVGVVGAKLYYSDGFVQHAGDTVGPGGCASHLHSMVGHDSSGYCNRAVLAQDLSAVTGACLMTWRKIFLQVGGLDQVNLAIAFNDVDYCLKVREAGYRVVWTPYAELYHYESVSRGQDDTPDKVKRSQKEANYMRKRWKHVMHHDPFYNPNLSYQRPDFSLSHAPMVPKPWINSLT